jgi:hypothetical protein
MASLNVSIFDNLKQLIKIFKLCILNRKGLIIINSSAFKWYLKCVTIYLAIKIRISENESFH